MKKFIITIIFSCITLCAATAQDFSISLRELSVTEALREIGLQTGYEFFYDSNQLSGCTKVVSIDFKDTSLEEILHEVLAGTGFTCRIEDKTIIVSAADGRDKENAVIEGQVLDDLDGSPIPGVSVYVEGTMNGTFTDADGRFFHTFPHDFFSVTFTSDPVSFKNRRFVVVSAELIDAVHDNSQVAFCHSKVFGSIAPAAEGIQLFYGIIGDSPVGADHSVVAAGSPQQIPDHIFTVGIPHVFMIFLILVPGYGIVGHDSRRFSGGTVQQGRERQHADLEE